jgi:predicted amidohydrolase YtcJ
MTPAAQPSAPLSCDLLLTNAAVLTMNANLDVFLGGSVAVSGDTIVAVGGDAASTTCASTSG